MKNYIGIANTFHDGAIAIVNSKGEVVFAEGTERHLQYKRAINVSPDLYGQTSSIIHEHCEAGAELIPAFSWSAKMLNISKEQVSGFMALKDTALRNAGSDWEEVNKRAMRWAYASISQWKSVTLPGIGLSFELSRMNRGGYRVGAARHYDHHLTHALTGCLTSPFEEALCAIVDGFGEGQSFSCYSYANGKLEQITTPPAQHLASLGFFYSDVCNACGFDSMSGEEWKVMGLAPYGKLDDEIYELLKSMIWVNGLNIENAAGMTIQMLQRKLYQLRRKENESPLTVANIAFAGQRVFTEVMLQYLSNLHERGSSSNLVLGGGCALNSAANGKILGNTPFKHLHVFAAPADDGNAIGAALRAFQDDHPDYRPPQKSLTPYLGSTMSRETLNHVVQFGRIPKLTECKDDAPERAAEMLSKGMIIGWIQGRAEFGPRALGNRSILADPRPRDIKETINARVKFREEFRPFAPSILHECGPAFFEDYQESPYMERALRFKEDVVNLVPGVVHHDGTGRLQTVKKEWNESYYRLIFHFWKLTKVPLVLNTSFNVMGKPIAHTVEDAIAVFYTSGLDAMFIENVLIEK